MYRRKTHPTGGEKNRHLIKLQSQSTLHQTATTENINSINILITSQNTLYYV